MAANVALPPKDGRKWTCAQSRGHVANVQSVVSKMRQEPSGMMIIRGWRDSGVV